VHAHEYCRRRVDRGDFLEGNEIRQGVEAESVVLLGDHHAEKTKISEFADEGRLEVRVTIPGVGIGSDLALGELARGGLNRALLFRERG